MLRALLLLTESAEATGMVQAEGCGREGEAVREEGRRLAKDGGQALPSLRHQYAKNADRPGAGPDDPSGSAAARGRGADSRRWTVARQAATPAAGAIGAMDRGRLGPADRTFAAALAAAALNESGHGRRWMALLVDGVGGSGRIGVSRRACAPADVGAEKMALGTFMQQR